MALSSSFGRHNDIIKLFKCLFLFVFELYDIGIELLLIYLFPALPEFFFFLFFFLPVTTLAFISGWS